MGMEHQFNRIKQFVTSEPKKEEPRFKEVKIRCQNCNQVVEAIMTGSADGYYTAVNCPNCKDPVIYNSKTPPALF